MFFFSGYLEWGNMVVPLKENLFSQFGIISWDPYDYFGIMPYFPWINILNNIFYILFFILGGFWNMNIAVKLYVFLSTFAATYSFYIMTGRFVKFPLPRIFATLFFLLTPAILQQIGQGDFGQLVIDAIYFASVTMLSISVLSSGQRRYYFMFLSLFLLALTLIDIQHFYLGVPLYFLFMLYFKVIEKKDYTVSNILSLLKSIIISIILLTLFSMPFILTSLFGSFDLLPNSPIANGLNSFALYSANFFNMLLMNPFQNLLPSSVLLGSLTSSPTILAIWRWSTILLVVIIIESGIAFRDRKIFFWTVIIIIAALLGSDYLSPLSPLTVYLYTHMIGYQVLNDSSLWEWYVITPLYSIVIAILFERLLPYVKHTKNDLGAEHSDRSRKRKLRMMGAETSVLVVSILIILVVIFPLVGQGFYAGGNAGIHQDYVPSSYDNLTIILNALVGKSNVGIAFFTPDSYVYFGNSTNGVNQPLLVNPTFRYPGIPTYRSPQVVSSYYFYWLYNEFYLNDTQNIAQLFGIMGVKYFVTLNGVVTTSSLDIANKVNPTKLMHYQKDIKLLYSTASYSIFKSTLDVNIANGVSDFSIMSGNYNVLMDAAALGVNLSKILPVFSGDINSSNFNFFLNDTASMIFLNSESLVTLSIDKFANSSNTIDPLSYTDSYYYSPSQGWMNSLPLETTSYNNILSDPYPFAVTATNKSMSINFQLQATGNYTVWSQVLLSQSDSRMRFSIDGSPTYINNGSDNITIGTFQWTKIAFHARNLSNNLNITSLSGLNGIQRIVILKSGFVKNEISDIEKYITSRRIPVLYLDNAMPPVSIQNVSLHNLTNSINSVEEIQDPVKLVNNPNGYSVKGIYSNVTVVRYDYFEAMIETVKGFQVYPIMGGLIFVVVSKGSSHVADFVTPDYKYLLYGIAVYMATIVSLVCYFVITFRKDRELQGKNKK